MFLLMVATLILVYFTAFKPVINERELAEQGRQSAAENQIRAENAARDARNAQQAAESAANSARHEAKPLAERFKTISPSNTIKGTVIFSRITGKRAMVVDLNSTGLSLVPAENLRVYEDAVGENRVRGTIDTYTWENVNQMFTRLAPEIYR